MLTGQNEDRSLKAYIVHLRKVYVSPLEPLIARALLCYKFFGSRSRRRQEGGNMCTSWSVTVMVPYMFNICSNAGRLRGCSRGPIHSRLHPKRVSEIRVAPDLGHHRRTGDETHFEVRSSFDDIHLSCLRSDGAKAVRHGGLTSSCIFVPQEQSIDLLCREIDHQLVQFRAPQSLITINRRVPNLWVRLWQAILSVALGLGLRGVRLMRLA